MVFPRLRTVVVILSDFGGVGDGVTVNTVAFKRAVVAVSKFEKRGGAQLNVQRGCWLTAPFNLTSHMTLFLAEGAVIIGIEDEYFQIDKVSTKHNGYFVNRGKLEMVWRS